MKKEVMKNQPQEMKNAAGMQNLVEDHLDKISGGVFDDILQQPDLSNPHSKKEKGLLKDYKKRIPK